MARNPFGKKDDGLSLGLGKGWAELAPDLTASTPTSVPEDHIASIPTANWQPRKRKKDKRNRGKGRAIYFLPQTKNRLERHANQLGVPRYEMTRYLLEYALDAVDDRRLIFEPELSPTGLTLYPDENRNKRRRKAPPLVRVTERGIPDETWSRITQIADVVPVWQVVNRMLEYGMDALESGQLQPQPHRSGTFTLY